MQKMRESLEAEEKSEYSEDTTVDDLAILHTRVSAMQKEKFTPGSETSYPVWKQVQQEGITNSLGDLVDSIDDGVDVTPTIGFPFQNWLRGIPGNYSSFIPEPGLFFKNEYERKVLSENAVDRSPDRIDWMYTPMFTSEAQYNEAFGDPKVRHEVEAKLSRADKYFWIAQKLLLRSRK
jgi:hypothetical protein